MSHSRSINLCRSGEPRTLEYGLQLHDMSDLSGMSCVVELKGPLQIYNLHAADLSALKNLRRVTGLSVRRSPGLRDLSGLDGLEVLGELYVEGNPHLESLDGLPEDAELSRAHITRNPALRRVDLAARSLGSLLMRENPALESVSLPHLQRAEALTISDTPQSLTLSLPQLAEVEGGLRCRLDDHGLSVLTRDELFENARQGGDSYSSLTRPTDAQNCGIGCRAGISPTYGTSMLHCSRPPARADVRLRGLPC